MFSYLAYSFAFLNQCFLLLFQLLNFRAVFILDVLKVSQTHFQFRVFLQSSLKSFVILGVDSFLNFLLISLYCVSQLFKFVIFDFQSQNLLFNLLLIFLLLLKSVSSLIFNYVTANLLIFLNNLLGVKSYTIVNYLNQATSFNLFP